MPPERTNPPKRRLPFKAPSRASPGEGPSSSKPKTQSKSKPKQSSAQTSQSKSKQSNSSSSRSKHSTAEKQKEASNSDSSASSPSASTSPTTNTTRDIPSPSPEPDYILAEITDARAHADNNPADVVSSDPGIPPKLLTRLLHHHFQNPKTKVAKDANGVIAKYVDVFVREALARAAFERAEGATGERSVGDGFLEVEDLEKMAPQLAMDF